MMTHARRQPPFSLRLPSRFNAPYIFSELPPGGDEIVKE